MQQPSQTSRSKGSKAARGGAGTRTAAALARANNTAAGADGATGATGATQPHTEGAQMTGAGTNTEGTMPSNTQLPSQSSTSQQPLPQDSPAASSTSGPATTNAAAAPATTAPPAKRQRVSRACDQCRAMREKCDGAQPQCSSCVAQNRACTYKTSPKKRGVQTGYIRTLELTLSSLLDEVPGCADALDGLFGRHGGDAAQRLFNPEASASGGSAQQQKDLERHNRLHRRWHKSRARREINRLLSTDGFSAGVTRPLSDRAGSDEDTDTEGPASTAPAAAAALNRPPGATSAVTWSPSENTIPSPLSNTGTGNHADDNTRLPLPPNHWRLLDVYFSYTHCWFPILERQDVLKAVYQYERELGEQQPTSAPAQAPSTTSAASAELWSVLALASFQDAASRQQQHHQHHPDSSNTLSTQQTRDPWPAWSPHRIYNVARQMIPLDDGPFEIQHARALLLLSLVNIGRRRYTAARVLIALSRQIFQDADCLSRVNDYAHGPMSMRRRIVDAVTSGCCILEAFLSIVRFSLGQQLLPPHHHHQQQQYRSHQSPGSVSSHTPHNCPAVPEDGLDEWQPWVPCVGFGVEDAAASERSPAYSLTTFNQLHALFTFMQNQGTNASSSPSDYNDVIAAAAGGSQYGADVDLDRVLRPDVPFSGFVRSPERVSAPVPSAYVLRITFVWMHILLSLSSTRTGGIDHARAHLLADVLEQFVARFGAAGAPPTIVPCVLTVVEHPSFKQLPPPLQQRLCALGDALEAVWDVPQQSKKQSSMLSSTTTNTTSTPRSNTNANAVLRQKLTPGGGTSSTTTAAPAQAPTSAPPAAVVYQSASPESAAAAAHHQQQQQQQQQAQAQGHHQGQQQRQTARHHRMSFLEQTQPHPPQQQPQQQPPQPSQDVNMYNGTGGPPPPPPPAFGFHPLPISPPNAGSVGSDHQQQQPQSQQQPPPPGYPLMSTPYPGDSMAVDAFGGAPGAPGTLDYEALLDDLSAVDYLDRLDADIGSQFMANLGFAPGMDNNLGTMMGEFGGL